MNITEFFYNNGQLNLELINIVSNIVLVSALVIITGWYASEVKKQTKLMINDKERGKILEEVQTILTPTINNVLSEINAIDNKDLFWIRYTSGPCGFDFGLERIFFNSKYGSVKSLFTENINWALRDILIKFPSLSNKLVSHDSLIDELNELFEIIETEIETPELRQRLKEMVKEFNIEKSSPYALYGEPFDKPFQYFSSYIINSNYLNIEKNPNSIQPYHDFWNENKYELLKFRETSQIKDVDAQILYKLSELKTIDEKICKEMDGIREAYRKKYHFTDVEMNPLCGI